MAIKRLNMPYLINILNKYILRQKLKFKLIDLYTHRIKCNILTLVLLAYYEKMNEYQTYCKAWIKIAELVR